MGRVKHRLLLNDAQLELVAIALHQLPTTSSTDMILESQVIIGQIRGLKEAKAQAEKTAKLTRSKEDLAREALIAHIEDVLFNPASRSEAARDFRDGFLRGRDEEIPRLKAAMLKDAKSFPEPTDEEWEWNGECPDYMDKRKWHPWYSGRVGGLYCEISFDKSASKVTRVYVEID